MRKYYNFINMCVFCYKVQCNVKEENIKNNNKGLKCSGVFTKTVAIDTKVSSCEGSDAINNQQVLLGYDEKGKLISIGKGENTNNAEFFRLNKFDRKKIEVLGELNEVNRENSIQDEIFKDLEACNREYLNKIKADNKKEEEVKEEEDKKEEDNNKEEEDNKGEDNKEEVDNKEDKKEVDNEKKEEDNKEKNINIKVNVPVTIVENEPKSEMEKQLANVKLKKVVKEEKPSDSNIKPTDKKFLQKALSNKISERRAILHMHDEESSDSDDDWD